MNGRPPTLGTQRLLAHWATRDGGVKVNEDELLAELRTVGANPNAARYAGINITRNTIFVMMLSGALAGLGGMSEVTGVVHRLQTSPIAAGYGFTGIIVAWLAKLNPLAIIFVSVLFGALLLAGREIQPSGVPKMIQGIILVCLIASDFLLRYRVRIVSADAEE